MEGGGSDDVEELMDIDRIEGLRKIKGGDDSTIRRCRKVEAVGDVRDDL